MTKQRGSLSLACSDGGGSHHGKRTGQIIDSCTLAWKALLERE